MIQEENAMTSTLQAFVDKPLAVSIKRGAGLIGLSTPKMRQLVKSGRVRGARVDRRIVIPMASLEQFLRECTAP
jgi:hypothetical protein